MGSEMCIRDSLTHVPMMTCVAPRISCRPFPEQSFPSRSSPMHSGHRTSRAVGGPIPPLPGKPLINTWKIAWRAPFGYARRLPGAPQAEGEALRATSSRTAQRKKCFFSDRVQMPRVLSSAPRVHSPASPRPARRPRSRLRLVPLIALPARRPRPTGYQHPAPTPPAPASPPMQDSCSVWCFSSISSRCYAFRVYEIVESPQDSWPHRALAGGGWQGLIHSTRSFVDSK